MIRVFMCVTMSGAIGGGLAPLIATSLLDYGDGNPLMFTPGRVGCSCINARQSARPIASLN